MKPRNRHLLLHHLDLLDQRVLTSVSFCDGVEDVWRVRKCAWQRDLAVIQVLAKGVRFGRDLIDESETLGFFSKVPRCAVRLSA